jgi:hypothetical protein
MRALFLDVFVGINYYVGQLVFRLTFWLVGHSILPEKAQSLFAEILIDCLSACEISRIKSPRGPITPVMQPFGASLRALQTPIKVAYPSLPTLATCAFPS